MPTILSPVPPVMADKIPLAPRPESLAGARIGILDNCKANAGRLLASVADYLVEHEHAVLGPSERKPHTAMPAPDTVLDRLVADSDIVLTASADCGSCSSGCVQDAVALERRGMPCVLLGSETFEKLIGSLAEWFGLAEVQTVLFPHPLGGISEAEVDAKALAIAPSVADAVFKPAGV